MGLEQRAETGPGFKECDIHLVCGEWMLISLEQFMARVDFHL
jgi:hypothetical protein